MGSLIDNGDRLSEIESRAKSLMGFRFVHGERVNGPGGVWPVQGWSNRPNGSIAEHEAKVMRGDVEVRGPSAYFTAREDAETYARLAEDVAWLVREHRCLMESLARNI